MNIVLVGYGNVGTHLKNALTEVGYDVLLAWNRSCGISLKALPEADVYIIAVKDDALEDVAKQMSGNIPDDAVVLHTAGTLPLSLITPYFRHSGVLYPMQTFSRNKAVEMKSVPFFVEGVDAEADAVARELAESLSDSVYELSSEQRRHLHLSAVWACNFVNHCYAQSASVLSEIGVPFSVMLPLIDETARKVHEMPPADAQTGPAARGDENVMQMQMQLIKDDNVRELYRRMSNSIMNKND